MTLSLFMTEKKVKFLKAYAHLPETIRNQIIVVYDEKTYTWDAVYFEVKNDTSLSKKLLNTLFNSKIIWQKKKILIKINLMRI